MSSPVNNEASKGEDGPVTRPPDPGRTPEDELEALITFARLTGGEITIDFRGGSGGSTITAELSGRESSADAEIAERVMRLAPYLISCDIPDWNQNSGSEGRIRIS